MSDIFLKKTPQYPRACCVRLLHGQRVKSCQQQIVNLFVVQIAFDTSTHLTLRWKMLNPFVFHREKKRIISSAKFNRTERSVIPKDWLRIILKGEKSEREMTSSLLIYWCNRLACVFPEEKKILADVYNELWYQHAACRLRFFEALIYIWYIQLGLYESRITQKVRFSVSLLLLRFF